MINARGAVEDLSYVIEVWSGDDRFQEEIIARIGNLSVARIAFLEAVRVRRRHRIFLKQGTQVLCDSGRRMDDRPIDEAVDQAIAACDGDPLAALKASLIACSYLEQEVKDLAVAVSRGYAQADPARTRQARR